jgi:hypothetical protein
MITSHKIKFIIILSLFAIGVWGCGPAETITDTITEDEFNQEEFICQDYGLSVDFQPGKIVCTGEVEGKSVVIEFLPELMDGYGYFQILRFSEDGVNLTSDVFADLNAELALDTYAPEEGYRMTSIIITEDDLTITSTLK